MTFLEPYPTRKDTLGIGTPNTQAVGRQAKRGIRAWCRNSWATGI